MTVDYRINLSRGLTSSEEERVRFYNRMLIYLGACVVAAVFVAFSVAVNLNRYFENRSELRALLATKALVPGLDAAAFADPDEAYAELEAYSGRLGMLRGILQKRVRLLPVVHNLFADLPEGVSLQSLSAGKEKILFGLVMPPPSDESGDPVRMLREIWERNGVLAKRVSSIRPVTGERRTMGSESVFYIQFECVLKK